MKLIAMYLPQYHRIPENDKWWGDGYTEWSAVKNAKPLFKNHQEPKEPLNDNYYDLSDESGDTLRWQASLANKYGVYGFCFYHYWFGGKKMLLSKPAEILLNHPDININFCFSWANETWSRNWYGVKKETLIEQKYDDTNGITDHFSYLLPFFKDKRYIKIDNKPVFCIYKTMVFENISLFINKWNELAKKNGFLGIYFISCSSTTIDDREPLFNAYYDFEPGHSLKNHLGPFDAGHYYFSTFYRHRLNSLLSQKRLERIVDIRPIYKSIVRNAKKHQKENQKEEPIFSCVFPCWDNTPRRQHLGTYYKNSSPQLFGKLLRKLNNIIPDDQFVFVNAWNEWGEGCYLEPDRINKYAYLEEIQKIIFGRK